MSPRRARLALLSAAVLAAGLAAGCGAPPPPIATPGHVLSQEGARAPVYVIDAQSGQALATLGHEDGFDAAHATRDAVYLVGGREVTALRLRGGTAFARYQHDGPRLQPVVAADDTTLYAVETPAGGTEALIALALPDLKRRWRVALPTEMGRRGRSQTPLVAAGLILLPSDGALVALDAAGGAAQWTFAASARLSWPAYAGGLVFVADERGILHAIEPDSGQERWQQAIASAGFDGACTGWCSARLTASAGALVVRSNDALLALDPVTGQRRWTRSAVRDAVVGHAVAFAELAGGEYGAIDLVTGRLRWRRRLAETLLSRPLLADDDALVIVREGSAALAAYEISDGRLRWRFDLSKGERDVRVVAIRLEPGT